MRRRCGRGCRNFGVVAIVIGVAIILAMIFPGKFWVFAGAFLLIMLGIRCLNR